MSLWPRNCQRLEAAGRHAQALAAGGVQVDAFVIRHALQFGNLQPARVAAEEVGEQRGERQALAFDQDAHVEVEPAVVGLDQFGIPAIDLDHVVTKILREFDLPAGFLQARCALLHERYPVALVGQAEDALRRAAEGVQGVAGNLLQAAAGQRFEGFGFRLRAALQADGLAFRQGDEFTLFLGADVGIPITEDDLGHVELAAAEILRIVAPGAVAVGVQGFQLQHRNERRIDQAQAVARLAAR